MVFDVFDLVIFFLRIDEEKVENMIVIKFWEGFEIILIILCEFFCFLGVEKYLFFNLVYVDVVCFGIELFIFWFNEVFLWFWFFILVFWVREIRWDRVEDFCVSWKVIIFVDRG